MSPENVNSTKLMQLLFRWLCETEFLRGHLIIVWSWAKNKVYTTVYFTYKTYIFYSFYKSNYVQRFHYSRPVRKGSIDPENEFAVSIINCLYCCEVIELNSDDKWVQAMWPRRFIHLLTILSTIGLRWSWSCFISILRSCGYFENVSAV